MTHLRKYSPDRFLNVWVNLVKEEKKRKKSACVTAGKIQNAAACKNAQTLCLCRQTVLNPVVLYRPLLMGRIDFENNLKHSPESEKALVPKLSPFTQLLLIRQRKPFSRSHSVCSFFLLAVSSSFFHDGAAQPFPTENYSESLSTAPSQSVPPSLCSLLRGPSPSSSPSGAARKESSVMALWRENGGIHPMLCRW